MTFSAVVVGSGSAGRRHARALRDRCPDAQLTVVQRPDSTQPTAVLDELGARIVHSIDAALDPVPDIAVVATPATQHRRATERLLDSGATVLLEKPVAADLDDALAISVAASGAPHPVIVGYHLRGSDTVVALRDLLRGGVIGRVISFRFEVGQHLAQWRPGTDPASSVSARRELGGGALLELSHELDAVGFLLGAPQRVRAQLRSDGAPTDGSVDTVADLELSLDSGATGRVHLDMVSDPPMRNWEVRGSEGTLRADLLDGSVVLERDGATRTVHRSAPGERDRAEARLIDNLIDVASGTAAPLCSIADGVAALRLADAARRSAASQTDVELTARGCDSAASVGTDR